MDNFPPKNKKSPTDVALETLCNEPSITDPLGMYTGVPSIQEEPQQDQDDL